jgi:uncharacterized protein
MTPPDAPTVPYTILSGYRGSHAHGTYIAPESDEQFGTDDIDLMNVTVLPVDYYFGVKRHGYGNRGTIEIVDGPWDVVAYELRKFVGLLRKGNPNVLMLLWLDNYFVHEDAADRLIRAREEFTLTQKVIDSFHGYAKAQRVKMATKPTNQAYMGERRRALAEQFGYDVKNASHAIRLLRMLIDLLRTGKLLVDRTDIDADELISIKRGEWTHEQVLAHMDTLLDTVRKLEARTHWRDEVSEDFANLVCVRTIQDVMETEGVRF